MDILWCPWLCGCHAPCQTRLSHIIPQGLQVGQEAEKDVLQGVGWR